MALDVTHEYELSTYLCPLEIKYRNIFANLYY